MLTQNESSAGGATAAGSSPSGARSGDKPSVISSDLEVEGDLKSAGDVQIDGKVKGDIKSRSVTVSDGAHIEGSIFAQSVVISGTIVGQVESPKVSVRKTANVMGDILHETLEIESGAHFQGACRRLEKGNRTSSGQPVRAA